MLQPNLGTFVNYVNAPDGSRRSRAQNARVQSESEYAIETDFWKRMRAAIVADRKTTRDCAAVDEAAARATEKKQPSFSAVAANWPRICQRWQSSSFMKSPSGIVTIGGLEVAVRPLFSEVLPTGLVEHAIVWMNKPEPSDSAVQGAMRLVTKLDPDPSCRAVFVDARRGRLWTGFAESLKENDSWLDGIGAAFLRDAS